VAIDVNGHTFSLKGTRTIDPQWHLLYEPYLKFEEVELPRLEKGAKVQNEEIEELKKETQPPKRYTQASIIKELEKRNLGTKATRASILDNLYERGYVVDKSIKVTELGMKMDEFLASEMPIIVDEQLTRFFEDEMEKIREEKSEPAKVLDSAKEKLLIVLTDVSKREKEIGLKLAGASKDADFAQAKIAKCPKCEDGMLMLKFSYKTKRKFVACNKYPACTAIYNLPPAKIIKGLEEDAVSEDGKIYVLAGNTDGNLRKICINDETPEQEEKELGHKKYEQEGMECPNCHKGQMVLRKSFYGEFLGCNQYPTCKTMMKITNGQVNTTPIVPQPKKEAPKKVAKDKTESDEKPKKTKTSAKKKSSSQ
jgi:DNA topoisomerase-1